jgi:hypothetical protein
MASTARSTAMEKERSAALANMDLMKIVRAYVQQMVDEAQGYKALLLDKETMRIVSTLYGRTELAEHNVVHVERLDAVAGIEGKDHLELKVGFAVPLRCGAAAAASLHLLSRLHRCGHVLPHPPVAQLAAVDSCHKVAVQQRPNLQLVAATALREPRKTKTVDIGLQWPRVHCGRICAPCSRTQRETPPRTTQMHRR